MEQQNDRSRSSVIMGLFLVAAGILILADKMGAYVPHWLISWPMALIAIGFLIGLRHNFRNPVWIILIVVGGVNLIDRVAPELNFHNYIVPFIIIAIGLFLVLRPKRGPWSRGHEWRNRYNEEKKETWENTSPGSNIENEADFIDSTSIFGGAKKVILSKNFKGGDITCFMGGAELDLSQADIKSPVVLDVTQIFGGTKIIVPPTWDVKSEVAAVFGGIEDKRRIHAGNLNPDKVVILRGTSIFGGIEIKSY